VPWSPALLHPAEQTHPGEIGTRTGYWYTQGTFYRDPDPANLDKWQSDLTPFQEALIISYFRREAVVASYGYDLQPRLAQAVHRVLADAAVGTARFGLHAARAIACAVRIGSWRERTVTLDWLLGLDLGLDPPASARE